MLSLNIWRQMMPEYQVFFERSTLMLDDTEDWEDDDIEVGQRSVFRRIFKMGRGQPIRAADVGENKSYLSQFYSDLQTYCRKCHGTMNFIEDPKIFILNSVNMNYPTWIEDEIVDTRSVVEGMRPTEYVPVSDRIMASVRINANDHFRHETVLVSCPTRQARGHINKMSFRKVAQVLLLFKCHLQRGNESETDGIGLAYVHWFECKRVADSNSGGLYLFGKTKKKEVIEIKDIERSVHLIPKFGSELGTSFRTLQQLRQLQSVRNSKIEVKGNSLGHKEFRSWSDLVIEYYSEFWLNTWTDAHIYKTIW